MGNGFTLWLRSITGERQGYVRGYKQALKDVWAVKKGTVRGCFSDCKYKINCNCTLTNEEYLKCFRIKNQIRRAKI
jgi:hypothetical protein